MIRVCESGRNPTMRHLGRTHGVSVAWLSERVQMPDIRLSYCQTIDMVADIYTKAFADATKWKHACHLAGIVAPNELRQVMRSRMQRLSEISIAGLTACSSDGRPPAAPTPPSRGVGPSFVFDGPPAFAGGLTEGRSEPFQAEIDARVQTSMLCLVNQITWPVQKRVTTTGKRSLPRCNLRGRTRCSCGSAKSEAQRPYGAHKSCHCCSHGRG